MAKMSDKPIGAVRQEAPVAQRTPPVVMWAWVGTAILVFVAWCLIDWISGPYFKTVPKGPSDPPQWMQIELMLWQVISWPAALYALYHFVIRPWRRERSVGADGVLVLAFSTLWFQDPLSNAVGYWFTYNTSMFNMGSWAHSVPWFTAQGEPGADIAVPLLFIPPAYIFTLLLVIMLGCYVMRWAQRHLPGITTGRMIVICFVMLAAFQIVVEGVMWLPLGLYEYQGGHWPILGVGTYYQLPFNETLFLSGVWTAFSCLRFFTNDRGEMLIERGAAELRLSPAKKLGLRALAVTGGVHILFFVCYTVPNTMIGANSAPWPEDLQKRSYFTGGLCGEGTQRPCPGPGVGHSRDSSPFVGADGTVVRPNANGATVASPKIIPFDRGAPGGPD